MLVGPCCLWRLQGTRLSCVFQPLEAPGITAVCLCLHIAFSFACLLVSFPPFIFSVCVSFFLPVLLRYNWHTALCQLQGHDLTYIHHEMMTIINCEYPSPLIQNWEKKTFSLCDENSSDLLLLPTFSYSTQQCWLCLSYCAFHPQHWFISYLKVHTFWLPSSNSTYPPPPNHHSPPLVNTNLISSSVSVFVCWGMMNLLCQSQAQLFLSL